MLERWTPEPVEKKTKSIEMAFGGDIGVVQKLINRKEFGSSDGRKIAIILPGGIQKGVIQGAVGTALSEQGLFRLSDFTVASSAGVPTGLFCLRDQ